MFLWIKKIVNRLRLRIFCHWEHWRLSSRRCCWLTKRWWTWLGGSPSLKERKKKTMREAGLFRFFYFFFFGWKEKKSARDGARVGCLPNFHTLARNIVYFESKCQIVIRFLFLFLFCIEFTTDRRQLYSVFFFSLFFVFCHRAYLAYKYLLCQKAIIILLLSKKKILIFFFFFFFFILLL